MTTSLTPATRSDRLLSVSATRRAASALPSPPSAPGPVASRPAAPSPQALALAAGALNFATRGATRAQLSASAASESARPRPDAQELARPGLAGGAADGTRAAMVRRTRASAASASAKDTRASATGSTRHSTAAFASPPRLRRPAHPMPPLGPAKLRRRVARGRSSSLCDRESTGPSRTQLVRGVPARSSDKMHQASETPVCTLILMLRP